MSRDETLAIADRTIDQSIEPLMHMHGFEDVPQDEALAADPRFLVRVWARPGRRGRTRWIQLSISMDPRDIPFFVGVLIGVGDPHSFLDKELNGVPLWQYVSAKDDETHRSYEFDGPDDVASVIEQVAKDFTMYAADFLAGAVTVYQSLKRPSPPFPKAFLAASLVGQLSLMPWRAVARVARGGPKRAREAEREMREELSKEEPD